MSPLRRARSARSRGALALAIPLALAASSLAPSASAFCRSTTCTGGECARDEEECKTTGKKLFWKTACVGYSMHEDGTANLPMKHVRPAIARSFAAWVDLECEDGGFASLSFAELDDVSCHRTEFNPEDPNANIVLFQDTKWGYTSADNNLAKTTVTFDDETGEILDADIEINHAYNGFTISEENVEYDLVSVVTHEVGHFIGLDHSLDSLATMNATYERGTIDLRTIEPDDVAAACAAYPADREAACSTKPKGGLGKECGGTASEPGAPVEEGGCSVAAGGTRQGPAGGLPGAIFGAALAATLLRLRRPGRRPARSAGGARGPG